MALYMREENDLEKTRMKATTERVRLTEDEIGWEGPEDVVLPSQLLNRTDSRSTPQYHRRRRLNEADVSRVYWFRTCY